MDIGLITATLPPINQFSVVDCQFYNVLLVQLTKNYGYERVVYSGHSDDRIDISIDYFEDRGVISSGYVKHGFSSEDTSHSYFRNHG